MHAAPVLQIIQLKQHQAKRPPAFVCTSSPSRETESRSIVSRLNAPGNPVVFHIRRLPPRAGCSNSQVQRMSPAASNSDGIPPRPVCGCEARILVNHSLAQPSNHSSEIASALAQWHTSECQRPHSCNIGQAAAHWSTLRPHDPHLQQNHARSSLSSAARQAAALASTAVLHGKSQRLAASAATPSINTAPPELPAAPPAPIPVLSIEQAIIFPCSTYRLT